MLNWEKICSWCINIYFGFIPKVEILLRSQVNVSGCRQIIDLLAGPETWGQSRHSLLRMLQISEWCQPPPVKYIYIYLFIYLFFFFWYLFVAQACDWQERLLKSISAAVSKKSQQCLAFGCQLKGHQLLVFSLYFKAEKLSVAVLLPDRQTDRRLPLSFPDSSQWGVCRVAPVMA